MNEHIAPLAPSASWANNPENEVALYIITIKAGSSVELPTASSKANRMMYHIDGGSAFVESSELKPKYGMELRADVSTTVQANDSDVRVLILQGRPIAEPVAQHGPFVMNTRAEIHRPLMITGALNSADGLGGHQTLSIHAVKADLRR